MPEDVTIVTSVPGMLWYRFRIGSISTVLFLAPNEGQDAYRHSRLWLAALGRPAESQAETDRYGQHTTIDWPENCRNCWLAGCLTTTMSSRWVINCVNIELVILSGVKKTRHRFGITLNQSPKLELRPYLTSASDTGYFFGHRHWWSFLWDLLQMFHNAFMQYKQ